MQLPFIGYAKAKVAEVPVDAGKCRCDESVGWQRIELDWIGLCWAGLRWVELSCIGARLVETERGLTQSCSSPAASCQLPAARFLCLTNFLTVFGQCKVENLIAIS